MEMSVDEKGIMKRPSLRDEYVRLRAVEMLMPEIVEWYMGEPVPTKQVTRDLMAVIQSRSDGYEAAKELEKLGWAANSALVEVMDNAQYLASKAVDEMTEKWVKCLGIKPQFELQATVTTKKGSHPDKPGIVVKIYPETAQYGIRYPDMPETSHYLIEFEHVAAAT